MPTELNENWGPCAAPNCVYHSPRCGDNYCGACCQRQHEGPSSHYHPARRVDQNRIGFTVHTWRPPHSGSFVPAVIVAPTPKVVVVPTPTNLTEDGEVLLPITNNGYVGARGKDGDFDLLAFFDTAE